MKPLHAFLVVIFFGLLGVYQQTSAFAADVTVDVPGTYVHTNDDGATIVNVPGVNVVVPNEAHSMPTDRLPDNASIAGGSKVSSFVNAQLMGMDFSNQNLSGANFSNADLSNANFSNANLTNAIMVNATLTGANLTNANLTGANLTNATLDHTFIYSARFDGANLANVDMASAVRTPPTRPAFVDASSIRNSLKLDPNHPTTPRKVDLTVNFDFNSDKLTGDGEKQVQAIAAALQDASLQNAKIRIEGHTDNIGGAIYNQGLSERRANRVLQTLTEKFNISAAHLSAAGFGKTRPIASNNNDLGRAMNRRVTLVNTGN
jgi:hypothetical protein